MLDANKNYYQSVMYAEDSGAKSGGIKGGEAPKSCPPNKGKPKPDGEAKGQRKKGKKGRSGHGDNEDYDPKTKSGKNKFQDPFFYAWNEEAIKDMASFPFLQSVGERIGTADEVPGIIIFPYRHAVGSQYFPGALSSRKKTYAAKAAQAFFEYVTQGITGGDPGFEAPDLIMAEVAAASLAALFAEGKRAYGMCKYFLQFNETYAQTAVEALGFDYNSIVSDLANFRSEYNVRAKQFEKQIALVGDFTLVQRWLYIATNIFTDTDSPEYSTAFAYRCDAYMAYDDISMNTGTSLQWYPRGSALYTQDSYFDLIDELMGALNGSDQREIFGAIRRVYDDSAFIKVEELMEDYLTPVVRNDVVGAAIHNCDWISTPVFGDAPDSVWTTVPTAIAKRQCAMYQTPAGDLRSTYVTAAPASAPAPELLLDMYDHLVNPGNVLDITANMQFTNETYSIGSASVAVIHCRTEVLTGIEIYVQNEDVAFLTINKRISGTVSIATMEVISLLSHMDSHPLLTYGSGSAVANYIGEIDKYTFVSLQALTKLHAKCFYQLLALPANSKSVTK